MAATAPPKAIIKYALPLTFDEAAEVRAEWNQRPAGNTNRHYPVLTISVWRIRLNRALGHFGLKRRWIP